MVEAAPIIRTDDPVLYDFPLPLRKDCFPMGFPLSIATNSECILTAVEESWGMFHQRFATAPLQIRVGVREGSGELPLPAVHAQGNLISFIGSAENFSIGDLSTGFGYSWLTSTVAQNRQFVRYSYLDALTLTLIDVLHVSTVHAACIVLDGHGVLLCGESGAGKSSLAYACARRGWGYLCDDASCLRRHCADRTVIGNPYRLRLRPDAGRLFPEFKERLSTARPNGKMSIEIATSKETHIKQVTECQVDHVVFLERDENASASISPFPKEEALARLTRTIWCGSAEYRQARIAEYRNLLEVPVVRVRYSDLGSAVDCLERMVRSRN